MRMAGVVEDLPSAHLAAASHGYSMEALRGLHLFDPSLRQRVLGFPSEREGKTSYNTEENGTENARNQPV